MPDFSPNMNLNEAEKNLLLYCTDNKSVVAFIIREEDYLLDKCLRDGKAECNVKDFSGMLLSVLDSKAKVKITEQIIESIDAVSLLIIHQIWIALQKGIESKMSNATLRASQNGLTITFVVSSTNNRYLQMLEEFLGDDWPD